MAVITESLKGTLPGDDKQFATILMNGVGDATSMTTDTDHSEIFPVDMSAADESYEVIQGPGIVVSHTSTTKNRFQVTEDGTYRVTYEAMMRATWVATKTMRLFFQKSAASDFASGVSVLGYTWDFNHSDAILTASSQGQSDDVTYYWPVRAYLEHIGPLARNDYVRLASSHDQAGTVAVTHYSSKLFIEKLV